jgi:hypothetical protein
MFAGRSAPRAVIAGQDDDPAESAESRRRIGLQQQNLCILYLHGLREAAEDKLKPSLGRLLLCRPEY